MKAVILVGGQGTRLRPLTINTPKPLFPLVNRPFLDHVLYLLRAHGITDVVLAMAYLSESFEDRYGDGSHVGMQLTYVHEPEPLGTGGAIKNVESHLVPGETFLVFNGDILTGLDLTDMLRYHRATESAVTISLTPVEDPSAYGVVDLDANGRIMRFTEKPKREEATSNWINAGTYLMESSALPYIPPGEFYMVERGLFPTMLGDGCRLSGYRSDSYWMDIGTPGKYLQANCDLLEGRLNSIEPSGALLAPGVWAGEGTFVHSSARITGPAVLGRDCQIAEGAEITGPAVLGDGTSLGPNARFRSAITWEAAVLETESRCESGIVGRGGRVGVHSAVTGLAVVGDGANLGDGNTLSAGARLWPGKTLPDDALTV